MGKTNFHVTRQDVTNIQDMTQQSMAEVMTGKKEKTVEVLYGRKYQEIDTTDAFELYAIENEGSKFTSVANTFISLANKIAKLFKHTALFIEKKVGSGDFKAAEEERKRFKTEFKAVYQNFRNATSELVDATYHKPLTDKETRACRMDPVKIRAKTDKEATEIRHNRARANARHERAVTKFYEAFEAAFAAFLLANPQDPENVIIAKRQFMNTAIELLLTQNSRTAIPTDALLHTFINPEPTILAQISIHAFINKIYEGEIERFAEIPVDQITEEVIRSEVATLREMFPEQGLQAIINDLAKALVGRSGNLSSQAQSLMEGIEAAVEAQVGDSRRQLTEKLTRYASFFNKEEALSEEIFYVDASGNRSARENWRINFENDALFQSLVAEAGKVVNGYRCEAAFIPAAEDGQTPQVRLTLNGEERTIALPSLNPEEPSVFTFNGRDFTLVTVTTGSDESIAPRMVSENVVQLHVWGTEDIVQHATRKADAALEGIGGNRAVLRQLILGQGEDSAARRAARQVFEQEVRATEAHAAAQQAVASLEAEQPQLREEIAGILGRNDAEQAREAITSQRREQAERIQRFIPSAYTREEAIAELAVTLGQMLGHESIN